MAFKNTLIDSIFIPPQVKEIEWKTFFNMNNLKSIEISKQNKFLMMIDNHLLIKKTEENNENFDVLVYSLNDVKKVVIPKYIKRISSYSFSKIKTLKSVVFSQNSELISIEKEAFSHSSIEKISIPSTVNQICESSFLRCNHLKSVDFALNSELILINDEAFSYTSIRRIVIPNKVRKIGKQAFSFCHRLTAFEFLGDTVDIESACFLHSIKLSFVSFPNSKKINIANFAFSEVSKNFHLFVQSGTIVNVIK